MTEKQSLQLPAAPLTIFRVIEQKYTVPDGEVRINIKTLVYQKGVDKIRKILEEM